jgi:hypothetical protein
MVVPSRIEVLRTVLLARSKSFTTILRASSSVQAAGSKLHIFRFGLAYAAVESSSSRSRAGVVCCRLQVWLWVAYAQKLS